MASYYPNLTTNISLHTIPVVFLIALSPRFYARYLYRKALNKDLDTRYPRDFTKSVLEDKALDAENCGRIVRAEAAMSNNFEFIGFYAAAITAGNAAGLSTRVLNGMSVGYMALRLGYNYVYVNNYATPRVLIYCCSMIVCWTLFVMAGNAFNKRVVL